MRTTLDLNDELVGEARELTGVKEKTRLIHMGLQLLIEREAARQLAALGGSDPRAASAPRLKASSRLPALRQR
jgi:Arc/MetJ family transcription regulator